MIDEETKKAFLTELEKTGNVSFACSKTGVGRTTYYQWRKKDGDFRDKAALAIRNGRENISDVAEQALMMLVRDKNLPAIKYVLGHNSPRYQSRKPTRVILEHRSGTEQKHAPVMTIGDFTRAVYEEWEKDGEIPGQSPPPENGPTENTPSE